MKHVIITGASSGIGAEIAKVFSRHQWKLTLVARNEKNLKKLCDELPNTSYKICDLGDADQTTKLGEKLSQSPIDAIINNAGIYQPQSIEEESDETWYSQFEVNLMGPVRLTRACWKTLKSSQGCVLNISSTLGVRPIANNGAYSALKAALNNWTQTLALEGAAHGVRANAICPGIVDTPIHSYINQDGSRDEEIYQAVQKIQPLGRSGKPADIADMAYHFCTEDSAWMTGTLLNIDGGILLNS